MWVEAGAEGVVIAGRRFELLEETATSIKKISRGTKVLAIKTDLTVEKDVDNLFHQVNKTFGRPADVVLANAGLVSEIKPMVEEDVNTWWSIYVSPYPFEACG